MILPHSSFLPCFLYLTSSRDKTFFLSLERAGVTEWYQSLRSFKLWTQESFQYWSSLYPLTKLIHLSMVQHPTHHAQPRKRGTIYFQMRKMKLFDDVAKSETLDFFCENGWSPNSCDDYVSHINSSDVHICINKTSFCSINKIHKNKNNTISTFSFLLLYFLSSLTHKTTHIIIYNTKHIS